MAPPVRCDSRLQSFDRFPDSRFPQAPLSRATSPPIKEELPSPSTPSASSAATTATSSSSSVGDRKERGGGDSVSNSNLAQQGINQRVAAGTTCSGGGGGGKKKRKVVTKGRKGGRLGKEGREKRNMGRGGEGRVGIEGENNGISLPVGRSPACRREERTVGRTEKRDSPSSFKKWFSSVNPSSFDDGATPHSLGMQS